MRYFLIFLGCAQAGLCLVPPLAAQVDQDALAQRLLSEDRKDQIEAVQQVQRLAAESIEEPLRSALIRAAERENAARKMRVRRIRAGDASQDLQEEDVTLGADILEQLIRLGDPRVIEALAGGLDTGAMVPRALADYGELGARAILDAIEPPQHDSREIRGGLLALRFTVQDPGPSALSDPTMERVRDVAATYLDDPGELAPDIVLRWAVDLAVTLDDPALLESVELLASDVEEVKRRAPGLDDPQLVGSVQEHARKRLSGVQPVPPRH